MHVTCVGREDTEQNAFSGVLSADLNSSFTIATYDSVTIGFKLTVPVGARIRFQGSWDNTNWVDCTFRQMGGHGYSSTTSENESWIGSVSTFKYVRFLTVAAGSGIAGSVYGKLSRVVSVIEGIEHGYEPHKIGNTVKAYSFSGTDTNPILVWAPSDSHKLVITDIHFTVADNPALVSVSEGLVANNKLLFQGKFKPSPGTSVFIPISFSLPHVFSSSAALYVTQSDSADIVGVVHGYETEI